MIRGGGWNRSAAGRISLEENISDALLFLWTATIGFTTLAASQWWRRRWRLRLLLHRGGDCWPGVGGTRRRREIEAKTLAIPHASPKLFQNTPSI